VYQPDEEHGGQWVRDPDRTRGFDNEIRRTSGERRRHEEWRQDTMDRAAGVRRHRQQWVSRPAQHGQARNSQDPDDEEEDEWEPIPVEDPPGWQQGHARHDEPDREQEPFSPATREDLLEDIRDRMRESVEMNDPDGIAMYIPMLRDAGMRRSEISGWHVELARLRQRLRQQIDDHATASGSGTQ
jgi:hypothetical protein